MTHQRDEITATEAATLTGLSERTIRRRIARGEIPARHIAPNRYAINVRDLPLRQPADEYAARIEMLEHRVRLLELQWQAMSQRLNGLELRSREVRAASKAAESGDGIEEFGAEAEAEAVTMQANVEDATQLRDLLKQLAQETERLAPLLSFTSQESPADPLTSEQPAEPFGVAREEAH